MKLSRVILLTAFSLSIYTTYAQIQAGIGIKTDARGDFVWLNLNKEADLILLPPSNEGIYYFLANSFTKNEFEGRIGLEVYQFRPTIYVYPTSSPFAAIGSIGKKHQLNLFRWTIYNSSDAIHRSGYFS